MELDPIHRRLDPDLLGIFRNLLIRNLVSNTTNHNLGRVYSKYDRMAGSIMATTTPNYGWDVPTSTDYVKDGATAIETLGDDIDATLYVALGFNYPGLRLVKKQTILSAVASVQVTSAFSATYENYKIIVTGGVASGAPDLQLSLDGITTGYYSTLTYQNFASTTVVGAKADNAARWSWTGAGTTAALNMNFEVLAPFLAKPKTGHNIYNEMGIAATNGVSRQFNASTASATGFTITSSTGTLTGGTIYVYGYGIS